jgi:hypothetical protein
MVPFGFWHIYGPDYEKLKGKKGTVACKCQCDRSDIFVALDHESGSHLNGGNVCIPPRCLKKIDDDDGEDRDDKNPNEPVDWDWKTLLKPKEPVTS